MLNRPRGRVVPAYDDFGRAAKRESRWSGMGGRRKRMILKLTRLRNLRRSPLPPTVVVVVEGALVLVMNLVIQQADQLLV